MRRLLLCVCLLIPIAAACRPAGPPPPPNASEQYIIAAFQDLGPGVVNCFLAIADRESGDDPGARNPSGASGLFQIELPLHNDLFYAMGVPPDWWHWASPFWNSFAARELYLSSGIHPWGSC